MDSKTISVLLIEDNPGDAGLVREYLKDASTEHFVQYELDWVERANKAVEKLQQGQTYDVILLDLSLPDSSGFDSFQKIYTVTQDIPVIILTALEDQELVFNALRQGAQDYFFKGHADSYSLHRSISFAIERKKFAQRLLEKEARLRLLTSQLPAVLWTTDVDLNLTSVLGAGLKSLEIKTEDAVGRSVAEFFDQSGREAPLKASRRALNGASASFEIQLRSATFHAYVEPFLDLGRKIVGTIGVSLDITEWKRVAEELVRRSEEKYSRLFRHSNDGIFIYDLNGNILDVNLKGMNLLGFLKSEMFSLNMIEFHPSDAQASFRASMKKVDEHGFSEYEIPFKKRNGLVFPAEVSASAIDLSGQKVVQAIVRDITDRKKAEDRLRRANEELRKLNQLKTDFVSTVSHEFRTPLTIIMQASEILGTGAFGEISNEQKGWLNRIEENTIRLNKLLNEILDLSKLQSGKVDMTRESVDLAALVRSRLGSLQPLAVNKDIQLTFNVLQPVPKVWANLMRIEQVLNNLVENALKFTPNGGRIEVVVERVEDSVQLSVNDNGPGIRPENLGIIFDRFAQEKSANTAEKSKSGIGLGLAISKEIITQHQGRIWVESEWGKGSKFIFNLPITTRVPERRSRVILVVDDDLNVCRTIEGALTQIGYQVNAMRNGLQAFDYIANSGNQADLIVFDLLQPGEKSTNLVETLRQHRSETPVVIVTANPDDPKLLKTSEHKSFVVIPKPIQVDVLKRVVRDLVPLLEKTSV